MRLVALEETPWWNHQVEQTREDVRHYAQVGNALKGAAEGGSPEARALLTLMGSCWDDLSLAAAIWSGANDDRRVQPALDAFGRASRVAEAATRPPGHSRPRSIGRCATLTAAPDVSARFQRETAAVDRDAFLANDPRQVRTFVEAVARLTRAKTGALIDLDGLAAIEVCDAKTYFERVSADLKARGEPAVMLWRSLNMPMQFLPGLNQLLFSVEHVRPLSWPNIARGVDHELHHVAQRELGFFAYLYLPLPEDAAVEAGRLGSDSPEYLANPGRFGEMERRRGRHKLMEGYATHGADSDTQSHSDASDDALTYRKLKPAVVLLRHLLTLEPTLRALGDEVPGEEVVRLLEAQPPSWPSWMGTEAQAAALDELRQIRWGLLPELDAGGTPIRITIDRMIPYVEGYELIEQLAHEHPDWIPFAFANPTAADALTMRMGKVRVRVSSFDDLDRIASKVDAFRAFNPFGSQLEVEYHVGTQVSVLELWS